MTEKRYLPIGIFDSGMGGLSVLCCLKKLMPDESFIYYADNFNSPYGNYNADKIKSLTENALKYLFSKNIKMLVIACNTVTAAAVKHIRNISPVPVIGMEPALMPAIRQNERKSKILLLATNATLAYKNYSGENIITVPSDTLAAIIENNYDNDQFIFNSIIDILKPYKNSEYSYIVLGCTHYVLKKHLFSKACGLCTVLDGNEGTAQNTLRILKKENLLNDGSNGVYTKLIMTDGNKEKYKIYKKIMSCGNT